MIAKTVGNILALIMLIILSRWLYPLVQGNWATLYLPLTSKLPRTAVVAGAWLSLGAATGSIICAAILGLPLGHLTKERPLLVGMALGLFATGVNAYDFPNIFFQFNWFVGTIWFIEHISFIVGCALFTQAGKLLAERKLQNPGEK